MWRKNMKSLLKNEIDQVSGSRMSINPCYMYIDCSYENNATLFNLAKGSSRFCPQSKNLTDMENKTYNTLQTTTVDRETETINFLLNICT
jgi:hypothetical protein